MGDTATVKTGKPPNNYPTPSSFTQQLGEGEIKANRFSTTKCATNLCKGYATRACHVINANQNHETGKRYIVFCCSTCNGQKKGEVNSIRTNAKTYFLWECDCGIL